MSGSGGYVWCRGTYQILPKTNFNPLNPVSRIPILLTFVSVTPHIPKKNRVYWPVKNANDLKCHLPVDLDAL